MTGRGSKVNVILLQTLTRFERTGDLADLDAAIQAGQAAAEAAPAGHTNRAEILSNLGDALQARFGAPGT